MVQFMHFFLATFSITKEQVVMETVYQCVVENQHQVSSEVSVHSREYRHIYKLLSYLSLSLS